jgi:hypothetical protein
MVTRTRLAHWLRRSADRIAPPAPPSPAPLVRIGGRWWYRDEMVYGRAGEGEQPRPVR